MGTPYDNYSLLMGTVAEIVHERQRQVEKGFTKEKDDDLMPHNWQDLLVRYVHKVEDAETPEEYRAQLVKIAAIAVAAVEAYDRVE
jgi:hypothetical protein